MYVIQHASKFKLWIKYRNPSEYRDLIEYERVQNEGKDYRKAKRNFEKRFAKDIKVNLNSFYAYVRYKTQVKDTVGTLVNCDGMKVSDYEEMCNIFNEYFETVSAK